MSDHVTKLHQSLVTHRFSDCLEISSRFPDDVTLSRLSLFSSGRPARSASYLGWRLLPAVLTALVVLPTPLQQAASRDAGHPLGLLALQTAGSQAAHPPSYSRNRLFGRVEFTEGKNGQENESPGYENTDSLLFCRIKCRPERLCGCRRGAAAWTSSHLEAPAAALNTEQSLRRDSASLLSAHITEQMARCSETAVLLTASHARLAGAILPRW